MRAVVAIAVAVAVGLGSGAAMAADHYIEVWNPPEAGHVQKGGKKQMAAGKASKQVARKAGQGGKAQPVQKVADKSASKVGKTPQAGKKTAHVQPSTKAQNVAAGKNGRSKAATKTAGSGGGKVKAGAPGRALPPILS